jgi:hypothetical protein
MTAPTAIRPAIPPVARPEARLGTFPPDLPAVRQVARQAARPEARPGTYPPDHPATCPTARPAMSAVAKRTISRVRPCTRRKCQYARHHVQAWVPGERSQLQVVIRLCMHYDLAWRYCAGNHECPLTSGLSERRHCEKGRRLMTHFQGHIDI